MGAKWRVLVVDDEPINLQIMQQVLQDYYQLAFVKSGDKAIEVARKMQPDLILLDIVMPEMDGYEVFRILRRDEKTKDIPVIFVTSMGESEAKGLALGAVDYITKPINPPVVRARVSTHLALKLAKEELRNQNIILEEKVFERTRQIVVASDVIDELVELRRRLAEMGASQSELKRLEEWSPPKIGDILVRMGYLTESQLENCLRKQEEIGAHVPIGTILVRSGTITEEELQEAIEEQLIRFRGQLQ